MDLSRPYDVPVLGGGDAALTAAMGLLLATHLGAVLGFFLIW